MTIPGIEVVKQVYVHLTEVYDVRRFHNEREFAAYLGINSYKS